MVAKADLEASNAETTLRPGCSGFGSRFPIELRHGFHGLRRNPITVRALGGTTERGAGRADFGGAETTVLIAAAGLAPLVVRGGPLVVRWRRPAPARSGQCRCSSPTSTNPHGVDGARALGGPRARPGGGQAQPLPRRARRLDRPRRGALAHARGRRRDPGCRRGAGLDPERRRQADRRDDGAVGRGGAAPGDLGPPDGRQRGRSRSRLAYVLRGARGRDGSSIRGLAVPVPGEAGPLGFIAIFTRRRRAALRSRTESSRSSRSAPGRRSRTRAASARPASWPTSTRSRDCTTAATSTRRSRARSRARIATTGGSALIVFDLDDFKAINDRIGHLSGDAVLAEAAERVREVVRSADIACRVGGDEFAVILPESSTHDADQLYHRLRGAVSSRPVGQAGRLFVSAGIAEIQPDDDPTTFFERADEALYRAKELGKGRAVAVARRRAPSQWRTTPSLVRTTTDRPVGEDSEEPVRGRPPRSARPFGLPPSQPEARASPARAA